MSSDEWHRTLLIINQHGSGNGLVPSGTKPLPEPMLTQFCAAKKLLVNLEDEDNELLD